MLTLDSVAKQVDCMHEVIVVDSMSSDGTELEVVKYSNISVYIREPDNGLYEAWNKAITKVKGDWVLFLGAGDTLADINTLSLLNKELGNISTTSKLIYGNVILRSNMSSSELITGECIGEDWISGRPSLPNHQAVLHHKSLFENLRFDTSYRIAGDSKFLFESMKITELHYIPINVSVREILGMSTSAESVPQLVFELRKLRREMKFKIPFSHWLSFHFRMYFKYFVWLIFRENVYLMINTFKRFLGKDSIY